MKTTFFGGHIKKGLRDLCGREFVGKTHTTCFWASLEKFGHKTLRTPKILLAPIPMIRFFAKTSDIRNLSENIRSNVETSEAATPFSHFLQGLERLT